MSRGRKFFWFLVLLFAVYVIYTSPRQAADIVASLWHIVVVAVTSLFTFFRALLQRT